MNTEGNTSQVSFEGEEHTSTTHRIKKRSAMVSFVMRVSGGYVKDEKQASYVLVVVAVSLILFSLVLLLSSGSESNKDTFTPPANALPGEVIPPAI